MSKKIIIIGASSGLGEKIALDMAGAGWKVGIAARREARLQAIQKQSPDNIVYRTIDVTAPDCVERFYDLIEDLGGMDTLLYAAGVGYQDPDIDPAILTATLETNAVGFSRILTAAYKYFKDTANVSRGQIAAITSVAGTKGIGIAAGYSATKRYEQTFIDALDQLAHTQHVNVDFTDIRPGFIRTALLNPDRKYPMEMSVDYAAAKLEKAILKRRRVKTIDSRWAIVVFFWRLIPKWIWRRISLNM